MNNEDKKQLLKERIKDLDAEQLLLSTNRTGMDKLVEKLKELKYFTAQAAVRFHCNYEGGLVDHSLSIYLLFTDLLSDLFVDDFPEDSIIITSLLHDACKTKYKPNGHSIVSLEIIKEHIELTELEESLIKYHMGYYGSNEFANSCGWGKGEYSLMELTKAYNDKNGLALLFYFCDHLSSKFLEPVE